MPGIKVKGKTKYPKALKLANQIRSYLFEEATFGELRGETTIEKSLRETLGKLDTLWSGGNENNS